MKYSICYFPLVGVVVALLELLSWKLCNSLSLNDTFRGAIMTAIPILVTGGIHLDGFCDTSDAISSYQPREKKLEILKDSHIGAFALIRTLTYILLYFGAVSTLDSLKSVGTFGVVFCIERALSGISVVTFKNAKSDGMLHSFSSVAERRTVLGSMVFYLVVSVVLLALLNPIACIVVIGLSVGVFAYYRVMSYRVFGGITGDLAGYFLQLCEIVLLYGIVLTEYILRLY
jgi:adenosylcobinamide-GDP ribazoletransferase